MNELKPCPFCGGEIEERGGQCNYGKKITHWKTLKFVKMKQSTHGTGGLINAAD